MPTTDELAAKREANIKKKEEERARKIEEIKAKKAEKSQERSSQKDLLDQKKAAEEQRRQEMEEKEKKRAAKIAEIEVQREANMAAGKDAKAKGGVKYAKKDVYELKKVFDGCKERCHSIRRP
eukprot:3701836-Prymnesium_polylepis.1